MNNKQKKIMKILVFLVMLFSYHLILEQDRAKRLEQSIITFQEEYSDFIDSKAKLDSNSIDKLINSNSFNTIIISEYYERIKRNTHKNFKESVLEEKYLLNLLKNENTTNYDSDKLADYDKLVKQADSLIYDIEKSKESDISNLSLLRLTNKRIHDIVANEIKKDNIIHNEYLKAKNNINTSNIILNDCFEKQRNYGWDYDIKLSQELCLILKLDNCQKNEDSFYGYTLNNPQKVNKKLNYIEYVSYDKDEYHYDNFENFLRKNSDKRIYAEIYTKKVRNNTIYKYNIIAYPKTYQLDCKLPSSK